MQAESNTASVSFNPCNNHIYLNEGSLCGPEVVPTRVCERSFGKRYLFRYPAGLHDVPCKGFGYMPDTNEYTSGLQGSALMPKRGEFAKGIRTMGGLPQDNLPFATPRADALNKKGQKPKTN